MGELKSVSGSRAEDLFIDIFTDTFGADKAGFLYSQYPFFDIYQNARFADFVCESGAKRIAIEIDDEASHNPRLVSKNKFTDDLLKQNSMIHLGWGVYRWTVRQMQKQPDTVKDELRLFLGSERGFHEIEDYLPTQRGQAFDGEKLELREYQQEALRNLQIMRENKESIALLYQATGTENGNRRYGCKERWRENVVRCAYDGACKSGVSNLSFHMERSKYRKICR